MELLLANSGKPLTISEHWKESFFLEPVFTVVRNSGLQACGAGEKGTVWKKIFRNLQNFRTLFPFWTLPECICSTAFDPEVGCGLHSSNCIKRKLHYVRFSDNFPKFSEQLFQFILMKSSVAESSRVPECRLSCPCALPCIRKWLHQEQFLEIFADEIIPAKKYVMNFYFGSNPYYF